MNKLCSKNIKESQRNFWRTKVKIFSFYNKKKKIKKMSKDDKVHYSLNPHFSSHQTIVIKVLVRNRTYLKRNKI